MPFRDRTEAGHRLAEALNGYRGEDVVVYALPRGGVQVAAEIADALKAPLDLILVRKIGVPFQPELAMGAVVDGGDPIIVRNAEVIAEIGITPREFDAVCKREIAEIERRRRLYLAGHPAIDPAGKVAIVVDDGIATGATIRAALRATRQRKPAKLVLAVPVAPPDAIEELRTDTDEIVCLETPIYFGAIGWFYQNFQQLTDHDVIEILKRFIERPPKQTGNSAS